VSNVKNIVFTIITVVVVPIVFFVALEGVLTALGVGSHYHYFNTITIDGHDYYQENPDFADQFYPPSLNIGPRENTFPKTSNNQRLRVYLLGGSAAMGFPHKNHGIDRLLAAQLNALFPDREVEVINTAMTSVNSHVVYEVAQTLPANSADVAILLMGNNEVVGPYGPGTFNQSFLSSMSAIRSLQALKRTRLWQSFDRTLDEVTPTNAKAELEWQGMQMFVENGVAQNDARMQAVYSHFETNLRDIIDILNDKSMHVVVSTVPVNLRHSAPFLSLNSDAISARERAELVSLREQARQHALDMRWPEAQSFWEQAVEIDPLHADTHFQLATSLEKQGKFPRARHHYERALDLDGLRFRADTQINTIIERVAKTYSAEEVSLVHGVEAFDSASAPYAPGWNLLVEHVHYDFAGNALLAQIFADAVAKHIDPAAVRMLLDSEEVAARIGFPNHETIANTEIMQDMAQQPPFPGQSNYKDYLANLETVLLRITREVGEPKDVLRRRQQVVTSGVADWKLHFEMAALARHLKNTKLQYYHLEKLFELYPHNRESYINFATLLSQDGRWEEVIPVLERSLYYTRGREEMIVETLGWLGTAHLKLGEFDQAKELLLTVPKKFPRQIAMSLRAYGNLIKHSVDSGNKSDTALYLQAVSDYADTLIASGESQNYPMLSHRMAQLMTMGGDMAAAQRWQQ